VLIAITGAPRAGKSTAAQWIKERLPDVSVISTSELIGQWLGEECTTERASQVRRLLKEGCMFPYEGALSVIVADAMRGRQNQVVIIDGAPRFGGQVHWLRQLGADYRRPVRVLVIEPGGVALSLRTDADGPGEAKSRARQCLWYGQQYHEVIQHLTLTEVPYEVVGAAQDSKIIHNLIMEAR